MKQKKPSRQRKRERNITPVAKDRRRRKEKRQREKKRQAVVENRMAQAGRKNPLLWGNIVAFEAEEAP